MSTEREGGREEGRGGWRFSKSTIFSTLKENRMEQDEEDKTAVELKTLLISKNFGTTDRENKYFKEGGQMKMKFELLKC